jgi:hypothetical protein
MTNASSAIRASGKTSFYNNYFKPHGYVHVNQDTLKSREKCLAVVRDTITFGKTGCVVGESHALLTLVKFIERRTAVQITRTGMPPPGVFTSRSPSNSRSLSGVSSSRLPTNLRNTTTTIAHGTPRMFLKRRYVPCPPQSASSAYLPPLARDVPSSQRPRLSDSRTPCRSRMRGKGLMRLSG